MIASHAHTMSRIQRAYPEAIEASITAFFDPGNGWTSCKPCRLSGQGLIGDIQPEVRYQVQLVEASGRSRTADFWGHELA